MCKRRSEFKNNKLYTFLDTSYVSLKNIKEVSIKLEKGGAKLIQVRAKNETAEQVKEIVRVLRNTVSKEVKIILNDYVSLASSLDVFGVHLGQDDMQIMKAREFMKNKAIGISTHSIDQAKEALDNGACYIGFGPIFATDTKPDYIPLGLDKVREALQVFSEDTPIFFIGGINVSNIDKLTKMGVKRTAIVSSILCASNVTKKVEYYKKKLGEGK